MQDFYRRNLPHYQPENAIYHVVYRLASSLPPEAIERLRHELEEAERYATGMNDDKTRIELFCQIRQEYFEKFDSLLDGSSTGPHWLREPHIAELMVEAIHFRDKKLYDLIAFTVHAESCSYDLFSIGYQTSLRTRARRATSLVALRCYPNIGKSEMVHCIKSQQTLEP